MLGRPHLPVHSLWFIDASLPVPAPAWLRCVVLQDHGPAERAVLPADPGAGAGGGLLPVCPRHEPVPGVWVSAPRGEHASVRRCLVCVQVAVAGHPVGAGIGMPACITLLAAPLSCSARLCPLPWLQVCQGCGHFLPVAVHRRGPHDSGTCRHIQPEGKARLLRLLGC